MATTLYDATVPLIQNALTSLSAILKKAEAEHANASSLPTTRLHEDMKPLSFQVHCVTDISQKTASRLQGIEPATFEDNMTTFEAMHARIAEAQAIVDKADKDTYNSFADKKVPIGLGPGKSAELPGSAYVYAWGLPNIFFHLTTTYAIVRKEGVPVGKSDYLVPFIGKHLPPM